MKELVIMNERQAVTTSLKIAEVFGKRHTHVIDAVENKMRSDENSTDYKSMFYGGLMLIEVTENKNNIL